VTVERWQARFDVALAAAAIAAVIGVALQVHDVHDGAYDAGAGILWVVWLIFALDVAVMLRIHPSPRAWARSHWFEITVVVVSFPVWPIIAYGLLVIELAPALTVFDAVKLAKLVKAVRILDARAARVVTVAVVVGSVATGLAIASH